MNTAITIVLGILALLAVLIWFVTKPRPLKYKYVDDISSPPEDGN